MITSYLAIFATQLAVGLAPYQADASVIDRRLYARTSENSTVAAELEAIRADRDLWKKEAHTQAENAVVWESRANQAWTAYRAEVDTRKKVEAQRDALLLSPAPKPADTTSDGVSLFGLEIDPWILILGGALCAAGGFAAGIAL